MRTATARVGLALPRSTSLSIDRDTPHAAESCSSVQPFFLRRSRTRPQSRRSIGSSAAAGSGGGVGLRRVGAEVFGICRIRFKKQFLLYLGNSRWGIDI